MVYAQKCISHWYSFSGDWFVTLCNTSSFRSHRKNYLKIDFECNSFATKWSFTPCSSLLLTTTFLFLVLCSKMNYTAKACEDEDFWIPPCTHGVLSTEPLMRLCCLVLGEWGERVLRTESSWLRGAPGRNSQKHLPGKQKAIAFIMSGLGRVPYTQILGIVWLLDMPLTSVSLYTTQHR